MVMDPACSCPAPGWCWHCLSGSVMTSWHGQLPSFALTSAIAMLLCWISDVRVHTGLGLILIPPHRSRGSSVPEGDQVLRLSFSLCLGLTPLCLQQDTTPISGFTGRRRVPRSGSVWMEGEDSKAMPG